ncbi:imidazole glycerol phosphate synthase subunit HisH, partial [Endobacter medicaginis]|nr:imidazole glycerol phosphate synthase subunit HisH [Endobacter medicaginis]
MRIVVVDYDGGNLASAARACEEAAVREGIDATVAITDDAEAVRGADRIVLPGQG